jgi:hypothetical protein
MALRGQAGERNSPIRSLLARLTGRILDRRLGRRGIQPHASRMGTRIRFLGWYLPGIGHPRFSYPPFDEGNGHQPRSGPGPARLNSGYGSTHRSINSGVPFGKGTGRFSPASGSRSPGSPLAWSLGQRPRCLQQKAFACGWSRHHPARRVNDQPMLLADRPNRAFGIGTSPAFRCRDPWDERSAPRRYGIERRRQNPPCQRD